MSSQLKSDTARINGAKSHGPITPEGRAKSSANSLTHGLTAQFLLRKDESEEHYDAFLADYMEQFQPRSGVERDLVEVMVIARWRLRRLLAIEFHLFDTEMVRREKQIDQEFNLDDAARLAYVFQKMADNGQSLALIIRYEGAINRSYDRAFKQLQILQAGRQLPPQSRAATASRAAIPGERNEPKQPEPGEALPTVAPQSRRFLTAECVKGRISLG
jgi:hypothetical protein